jgi:hypothetical protein
MTVVLALDLSSTRTGICMNGEVSTFTPPKGTLLDRARATRGEIVGYASYVDLIVIEAIGTRMINTAIALATIHALVLDELYGASIQMVAPADLKKFATGKGNADKDTVMLAASKLEPKITNNDEADAWWLWAMGCWLTGNPFIETAYRRAVIDKMGAAGGK